jgi:hypothetical protein
MSLSVLCLSLSPRLLFVCKMQIRLKTAAPFVFVAPVTTLKQVNNVAIFDALSRF